LPRHFRGKTGARRANNFIAAPRQVKIGDGAMSGRTNRTADKRRRTQIEEIQACAYLRSSGEWRKGISPLRSRRTGREPLDSSGSHHSRRLTARSRRPNAQTGKAGRGRRVPANPTSALCAVVIACISAVPIEPVADSTVPSRGRVLMDNSGHSR